MAGTRMEEDAACMLLAAAASTRDLQLLDLRGCVLGTRGCAAMAQLLRWGPQLYTCHMPICDCKPAATATAHAGRQNVAAAACTHTPC